MNVEHSSDARSGDHMWYISHLGKFQKLITLNGNRSTQP